MLFKSRVFICMLLLALGTTGAALAQEPACTAGKAACAGCPNAAACAKSDGAPAAAPVPAACPACVESGGLCEACSEQAQGMLTQMAAEMCPACEADNLCEACQKAVQGAMSRLAGIDAELITTDDLPVACIKGTAGPGMEQLIPKAIEAAHAQGLMGKDTIVGCIYPEVMANGYSPEMLVLASVSLDGDGQPQAPLESYTVPGGTYLQVVHRGDYALLGESWMAGLVYALMHNFELGQGPAGEIYRSSADVPVAQAQTDIYIPVNVEPVTVPVQPADE